GNEVDQMMKVVGEEGTSLEDFIIFLKGDFLDAVYLQQNSFDPIDAAVSTERQQRVYDILFRILSAELDLQTKQEARGFFNQLRQKFLDYNGSEWGSESYKENEKGILELLESKKTGIDRRAKEILGTEDGVEE
ncbi:MAG: V-type ATP synthase subunit A, partial [Spirochaetia bacterium]